MDPTISGTLDLVYLNEALARAGISLRATDLVSESLTGGRTAAAVTRLQVRAADGEARNFVLKVVPSVAWREVVGSDATEARLWLSGTTRALPSGLRCPTIDVARHSSRAEWWILMDDVSSGIVPRGTFDETKARTFMRRVARMHARHWERADALSAVPLGGFEKSANALAALNTYVARGGENPEPWLAQLSEDFWVPRVFLPVLLNALKPEDADFYVRLCSDHPRIATALGKYPRTLCHGDLRRANIAFFGDEVALFDWEFACSGPAARDLQWHWFLQFWAYPVDDARAPEERSDLLDVYFEALAAERGTAFDRAQFDESCELAWLSTFCQIGCCLADPLADKSPSPDAIERAKRVIARAVERARRVADRHVR
jgi:hypothetical protein